MKGKQHEQCFGFLWEWEHAARLLLPQLRHVNDENNAEHPFSVMGASVPRSVYHDKGRICILFQRYNR